MKFIKLTTDKGHVAVVNIEAVESFGQDSTILGSVIIFRTGAILRVKDSIDTIWNEINDVKIIH